LNAPSLPACRNSFLGIIRLKMPRIAPANSLVLALLLRTLYVLASLPGALVLSDVLPGMAKAQPLLTKLDG